MIVSLPLDAVRCTRRVAAGDVIRTAAGQSIAHGGTMIPFTTLAALLGSGASPPPPPPQGRSAGGVTSAVVIQGATGMAALAVDQLLGSSGVMLRPLPDLAPAAAVVAGASLNAEGRPQLVLDPDALVAEAARQTAGPVVAEAERRPVLVIDDSLTTRMLEQSILESAGYDVDVATSGEEAIESARRKRYALFLVDVEMPGMDGFTFIERTRGDPALRDVPAILVTSRASADDRRRGQEVGAQGYIIKSEFDQAQLLGRVRQLAGQ
jgi:two-component system, chemotaxis family, sensor kinase CheA